MKINNLGQSNSLVSQYLSELRDRSIQKDSLRFRRNLERIGELFAYEISKTLDYEPREVETPLGIATCNVISDQIVISTILRAGLPIHEGFLNMFDKAENAFVATYRKYGKDNKCTMQLEYSSTPAIEVKTLIVCDAMIATGASLLMTYNSLLENGTPKHTHIACPIASADGVEYLSRNLPHHHVTLWVGAIDEELTNKSFIIPGIGDVGDLAFGCKI